jgi:hypothetical protein
MEPRAVKEKKEASNAFVLLPAITPTYMQHLMLRVMGSTYEILSNLSH